MVNKGTVYINKEEDSPTNPTKEAAEAGEKLDALAQEANTIIYEARSVFPFQLFPDKVVIDENKITIVRREFLFQRSYPLLVDDILTVRVDKGILFASLVFEVNKFIKIARPITHLKHDEANMARHYIMGLVQAKRAGVELSKLTVTEIRNKLEEIGKTQS